MQQTTLGCPLKRVDTINNSVNISLLITVAHTAELTVYGYLAALNQQGGQIFLAEHHQSVICTLLIACALILQRFAWLQCARIFMEKAAQQCGCIQGRQLFIGYRCSLCGKCFPSILGGIALGIRNTSVIGQPLQ